MRSSVKETVRVIRCSGLCLATALLLTGAAILAPASASTPASRGPHVGGALTIDTAGSWPTLDPSVPLTSVGGSQTLLAAIYGSLFQPDAHGNPSPDLALRYSVSANKRVVTLYLRHNVKFSDGTPFNATAVQWNLNRDRNPATGCLCAPFLANVTSVTASGNYTVVLHMSAPYSPIIQTFEAASDAYIISPTAFQREGEAQFGQYPVGAGPFVVAPGQNNINVKITLERNSLYWDKPRPYLGSITYVYVNNTSSAYAALESNEIQLDAEADAEALGESHTNQNLYIETQPQIAWLMLQLNTAQPPYNNIVARQAVQACLNFGPINTAVYGGLEFPATNNDPPGDTTYFGATPGYPKPNATKAAQLASSLGGITSTIEAISNSQTSIAFETAIQQEFAACNIKVNILSLQQTTVIQNIEAGNFNIVLGTYGSYADIGIADDLFLRSTGSLNHSFADPHVDALLNKAEATYVMPTRQSIYKELWEYVGVKKAYDIPVYYAEGRLLMSRSLQGIPKSTGGTYLENAYLTNG